MSVATSIWAQRTPGGSALGDERSLYTWVELDSLLNRATHALLAAGIAPGQRVAIFAENSAETVIAHLADILAGTG